MRLLLDTQAFLYALLDSPGLPSRARVLIESLENELFLSIAFDRMLVAQSMVKGLPLVSGDTAFESVCRPPPLVSSGPRRRREG